jgi:hypothetical protein
MTNDTRGVKQAGDDGPDTELWKVQSDNGRLEPIVTLPVRVSDLCWGAGDRVLFVVIELGGVHNDLWEVPLANPARGARRRAAVERHLAAARDVHAKLRDNP